MSRATNSLLHQAKKAKKDEFYTQLVDIENELKHYKKHFKNKVVYCNCDDPRISNFFHYFAYNFEKLELKKLITTCYKNQNPDLFSQNNVEKAIYLEYKREGNQNLIPYPKYMKSIGEKPLYTGDSKNPNIPKPEDIGVAYLEGDGDFKSEECIEILKRADIVVTNPPFSLFREYVSQLAEYRKKFVVIGPWNSVTYKEIFPLIKNNEMWLGYGFQAGNAYFKTVHSKEFAKGVYDEQTGLVKFRNVTWFTNLDHSKRHEDLILYKQYNKEDYPKYDNYNAINVNKTKEIPINYYGIMGVPITFLDKYNPDQFEIFGATESEGRGFSNGLWDSSSKVSQPLIGGNRIYKRVFIKKRDINEGPA